MIKTKAQYEANNRYIARAWENINFRVRKGERDKYKLLAEKNGKSLARLFVDAVQNNIDNGTYVQ